MPQLKGSLRVCYNNPLIASLRSRLLKNVRESEQAFCLFPATFCAPGFALCNGRTDVPF